MTINDKLFISGLGLMHYFNNNVATVNERKTIKHVIKSLTSRAYMKYTQKQIDEVTKEVQVLIKDIDGATKINAFVLGAMLVTTTPNDFYQLINADKILLSGVIRDFSKWGDGAKRNYKFLRDNLIVSENIFRLLSGEELIDRELFEQRRERLKKFVESIKKR